MPNPSPTPLSPNPGALPGPTRPYSALLGPTRPYSAPLGPNPPGGSFRFWKEIIIRSPKKVGSVGSRKSQGLRAQGFHSLGLEGFDVRTPYSEHPKPSNRKPKAQETLDIGKEQDQSKGRAMSLLCDPEGGLPLNGSGPGRPPSSAARLSSKGPS